MKMNRKGQTGVIIALVVGLIIAVILMVGVLVPIVSSTVTAQNFTAGSVNDTIGDNLTTFILIGVLVLIAGIAIYGMSRK